MSKPVETSGEEGLQQRAVNEITGTSGDANNRDANNSREATTAGRQQQQGSQKQQGVQQQHGPPETLWKH
jgi:hypothetical protein